MFQVFASTAQVRSVNAKHREQGERFHSVITQGYMAQQCSSQPSTSNKVQYNLLSAICGWII